MRRSETRILTTHAGSLPRPPALAELHGRRSRGEPVDAAAFDAEVVAATAAVIAAQADAGIDIGNDGEQARESFFTYVQHRMTGFGDTSHRPLMRDLLDHPDYMELALPRFGRMKVNLMTAPAAIGAVTYPDTTEVEAECALVRGHAVRRDVHDRGVARHRRVGDGQPLLRDGRGLCARDRRRIADRVPRDLRPRPAAADRRARPRDGTAHALRRPAPRRVPRVGRARRREHQPRAHRHRSALGCACTCAGATTRVRTPSTSRSTRSSRSSTARTSVHW